MDSERPDNLQERACTQQEGVLKMSIEVKVMTHHSRQNLEDCVTTEQVEDDTGFVVIDFAISCLFE
jgi:hypothetical protein